MCRYEGAYCRLLSIVNIIIGKWFLSLHHVLPEDGRLVTDVFNILYVLNMVKLALQ